MSDQIDDRTAELSRSYPEFDPIVQEQVNYACESLQRATGGGMTMCIAEAADAIHVSLRTVGKDKEMGHRAALFLLLRMAAGAISEKTNGSVTVKLAFSDGDLLDVNQASDAVLWV